MLLNANTYRIILSHLVKYPTMSDVKYLGEVVDNEPNAKVPGAPGAVPVPEDPAAPSQEVSSKRQRLSDLFTIVSYCRGWVAGGDR